MKIISFQLTAKQLLDGTKDVTRRLGWRDLKPGTTLLAVRQQQGLKKGEKIERLAILRVWSVSRETLSTITKDEVLREGFPDMDPAAFVQFFCDANHCEPSQEVTRIEFSVIQTIQESRAPVKPLLDLGEIETALRISADRFSSELESGELERCDMKLYRHLQQQAQRALDDVKAMRALPWLYWPCVSYRGPVTFRPNHDFPKRAKLYAHEIIRCRSCGAEQ